MDTINNVDIEFEDDLTIKADCYIRTRVNGNVSKESIIKCAKLCEVNEIFTKSQIIDYVKNNFEPVEVFSESDLDQWAKENYSV